MPSSAKIAKRDEMEYRRTLVGALMLSRRTVREIVDSLQKQGVQTSRSTVLNDEREIRKAWQASYAADFSTHVSRHMALLDALERTLVPQALGQGGLYAVDRLLGVMDRRAKLLGLDAPSKVEVTMKIELVARAMEQTLIELGLDASNVRPVLGAKLRELEAVT